MWFLLFQDLEYVILTDIGCACVKDLFYCLINPLRLDEGSLFILHIKLVIRNADLEDIGFVHLCPLCVNFGQVFLHSSTLIYNGLECKLFVMNFSFSKLFILFIYFISYLFIFWFSNRYPNPSAFTYERRLFCPFEYALQPPPWYRVEHIAVNKPEVPCGLSELKQYEGPQCFVIPGNHGLS